VLHGITQVALVNTVFWWFCLFDHPRLIRVHQLSLIQAGYA
jgi:hypothetical protein